MGSCVGTRPPAFALDLLIFNSSGELMTEGVQLVKQAPPEDAGIPFLTHLGTFPPPKKTMQPPFLEIIAKLVKR